MQMRYFVLALIGAVLMGALFFSFGQRAAAFGTVRFMGQNAEHERITRAALPDFGARALDAIAGRRGTFGAVGAPDRPDRGLMSTSEAHCDNGDYIAGMNYPNPETEPQAVLGACRTWMREALARAVAAAEPLATPDARNTALNCDFDTGVDSARCEVLENLGLAFHAGQDFYSHSNWTDQADNSRPIGPDNPPGLNQSGAAPWLNPRMAVPFPVGLMSGCYQGFPESSHCEGHTRHAVLNKDTGPIGPMGATGPGTTPRGAINGNFERAVAAAIADTHDKWMYFQERILETYGPGRGGRIICALTSDTPLRCATGG